MLGDGSTKRVQGAVLSDPQIELSAEERKRVGIRAAAICEYVGLETKERNRLAGMIFLIESLIQGGMSFSFTGEKLKELAILLTVSDPAFLLKEGKPSDEEMEAVLLPLTDDRG